MIISASGARRLTFRNKYLAVVTLTLLLFSVTAFGQVFSPVHVPTNFDRLKARVFIPLNDTTFKPPITDTGARASIGIPRRDYWWRLRTSPNTQLFWDSTAGGSGGGTTYTPGFAIDLTGNVAKLDTSVTNPLYQDYFLAGSLRNSGTLVSPYNTGHIVSSTKSALRSTSPDATIIYRVVEDKDVADFIYDNSDVTSADDSVMIIRNGAARYKRVIKDHINVKWFGAIGDAVHDDGPAVLACLNWMKSRSGRAWTMYVPVGQYAIYNTITFNYGLSVTINWEGEASGGRGNGAAFIWRGTSGQAMFKWQSMFMSRIENIDFIGRYLTGQSAKYLVHIDYVTPGLTSLLTFRKCAFGGVGGDSSACINFNATGANTNLQADETSWEDCVFSGNQINQPDSLKSWYGVIFGGNNTKNFIFRHNYMINFYKAIIKAFGGIGQLFSEKNITGTSDWHFDLTAATSLTSISDYAEANGGILTTPGGSTGFSSYTLLNYENHASNYTGANATQPTTKTYVIEGQGVLNVKGCTFNGGSHIQKINWTTDVYGSATVEGSTFTMIQPGTTPFYAGGNPLFTNNHELDYGITLQHNWYQHGNIGTDSTLVMTSANRFPDGGTADFLMRGLVKISAYAAKPTSSTDKKSWNQGDKVMIVGTGNMAYKIKEYICTKTGTFKTISFSGTITASSTVITGISSTAGIEVGDILAPSGGWADLTYPITVSAKTASTVTMSNRTAESSGTVSFTNATPVFQAIGGAYGTTTQRAGIDTQLTTTDKGFIYYNTDSSMAQVWGGTAFSNMGGTGSGLPDQTGMNARVLSTDGSNLSWVLRGDASTNTAFSVDGEIALFSGTAGKTVKRAAGSGFVKATSGVYSVQSSIDTTDIASFAAKVRSLFSAGSGISYNNGTGAITATGGGSGDFSSNTSTSVDGEILLFSGTAGKTGKRATGTGFVKATSGVYSTQSSIDTTDISNFYLKTRSLLSVTGSLTYNSGTGAIGSPASGTSTNGYLSSADYNRLFTIQSTLSNPTGTITINQDLGSGSTWNLTGSGTRTIAFSNLRSGDWHSVYINNTSGGNITLTLPGSSNLFGTPGGAGGITIPTGKSTVFLHRYDGTNYEWSIGVR